MHWEGLADAETAHPPQQNHLRLPPDFSQRLVRFKEESNLPWAELNRRLGTHPETVRRWRDKGVRPSTRYMMALRKVADSLGLGHLFDD